MASRRIEDLVPALQTLFHQFAMIMHDKGIPFIVTCSYRTHEEQLALYDQGRESLEEVNSARHACGLLPIDEAQNNRKVTWTLHSKHLERKAFDVAIVKDGKACWDLKADVDADGVPDYEEAGEIGESIGLTWGGRFPTPDRPHFQLKEA